MELSKLSVKAVREGLVQKKFSARELVEAYVKRIEATDEKIGAFLTVTADLAKEQAKQVDALVASGRELPSLAGVPVAVKDNILVQGVNATAGSKILESYVAAYDATVVERLRKAGAIILGKTNLDEFGMGASTENSAFKITKNPVDPKCVPGGSSGGSTAAVATNEALVALGTDTGGSSRQPASFCGVVGLKPTYGRVSRSGVIAMTSSLDQVGSIARSVEDAAAVYGAIAGHDSRDATTINQPVDSPKWKKSLKGVRIGVAKEFFVEGLDPEVESNVRKAIERLEGLGAKIVELSLPHTHYSLPVYYVTVTSEVSSNLARYDGIRYGASATAGNLFGVYTKTRARGFGPEAKRRIILGTFALSAGYADKYYKKAQLLRQLIREEYAKAFEKVDCLVGPTTPTPAFAIGEKVDDPLTMYLADVLTVPANIAGLCAISVPCGENPNGLPIGLQFIGRPFGEAELLSIARVYEENAR